MDNSKFQLELLRIYDGNENDKEFEKYRKELKELIDDPEYIPISKGILNIKEIILMISWKEKESYMVLII